MTPLVATLEATTLIKTFSTGRTRPYLTLCSSPVDDNVEVVLKLRSGFESSGTGLTCELMASLLARDLGLPVPEPYLVEVGDEFCEGVVNSEVTERLKANKGINFGTRYFTAGYVTWPQEMPVPACMLELAAELFAFDFMIQNPDRRRDKPNLLRKGDELLIFDHELGFRFCIRFLGMSILGREEV